MTVEVAELVVGGTPALVTFSRDPRWLYVFAHGAGAGMRHPFMATLAVALAERGVASLRWEFPYMAAGKKRPDRADVAEDAVRTTWTALRAGDLVGDAAAHVRALVALPMFAGGKSFGGRMTSRAQAWTLGGLPGLAGLVFLGFPLYGAGREPSTTRADHLARVTVPMLFVQGSRDELASLDYLQPVVDALGARARLHVIAGADHGLSNRDASAEIALATATWMGRSECTGGAPARS